MQSGKDLVYPVDGKSEDGKFFYRSFGLTKREHFTAMAMQGLYAGLFSVRDLTGWNTQDIAAEAVKSADALIFELNK